MTNQIISGIPCGTTPPGTKIPGPKVLVLGRDRLSSVRWRNHDDMPMTWINGQMLYFGEPGKVTNTEHLLYTEMLLMEVSPVTSAYKFING